MDSNDWRLIQDPLGEGSLNMLTDRAILLACSEGEVPPTLRLYGWERPTLSIGYSQDITKDIDIDDCERKNIPVVRRFTGGRALLHQHELTYSLIVPIPYPGFPGSLRGAFNTVSKAIVESLKIAGIRDIGMAGNKSGGRGSRRSPACFSMANHCEIMVRGKKLVGSAQRRLGSAFLQHGSILLDSDPNLTHGLLKYSSETEQQMGLEALIANTISLKQILHQAPKFDTVNQWFKEGFQKSFPGDWNEEKLSQYESNFIKNWECRNNFTR